ncbi:MAG: hypothetical protein LW817_08740 [Candidatus Caenarcaniphilales bacterium]|jgi:hypothetical protein|nr:hypothetical protein [Candidatus Caenarcaniphilales bacterium]
MQIKQTEEQRSFIETQRALRERSRNSHRNKQLLSDTNPNSHTKYQRTNKKQDQTKLKLISAPETFSVTLITGKKTTENFQLEEVLAVKLATKINEHASQNKFPIENLLIKKLPYEILKILANKPASQEKLKELKIENQLITGDDKFSGIAKSIDKINRDHLINQKFTISVFAKTFLEVLSKPLLESLTSKIGSNYSVASPKRLQHLINCFTVLNKKSTKRETLKQQADNQRRINDLIDQKVMRRKDIPEPVKNLAKNIYDLEHLALAA